MVSFVGAVHAAETVRHLAGKLCGIVFGGVGRSKPTKEGEKDKDRADDDGDFAENWLSGSKVGPPTAALTHVALNLLETQLIVYHATEGDGVAKELDTGNRCAPNHHRGTNQEDVLENTAESENDSRSLANLGGMCQSQSVIVIDSLIFRLTRNTTETLSMKAQRPLRKNVNKPTL